QPCFFPYVYKGNTYYTCNKKSEAQNRYWCATTGSYDKDKKWSYCADTKPRPCFFPFIFKKKSYSTCTKDGSSDGLWCSVTSNYDKDRKWIYCEPSEYGGNSNGEPCFFPYVYKGNTYYTCNKKSEAQNRYWCATTGNYDRDKKWSYCADTRLSADLVPEPCKFPFTFEGKTYTACTTDGTSDGRFWCSVTSNYDEDRKWIYCEPSGKEDTSNGLGIT
uniref:Fibronectin type-II domain-containing protein n=1 Tax=Salvator merianae TaxID=96440 RepID=A0A8D0E5R7_SALMN